MKKLAIKTTDNRLLFTSIKNLHNILEYAKNSGLELSLANTKINLELNELVQAICNPSINYADQPHDIIKAIYPVKVCKKGNVEKLKAFINNKLISENKIAVEEIRLTFPTANSSNISYCLSTTIKNLEKAGIKTTRIKKGLYQIKT